MIPYLRHFRWFVLALVTVAASGQVTVDIYQSPSTDGSYVYSTGVLQYDPGSNCTMCPSAYHTYQQTVTITSPSGRTSSCTFSDGSVATSSRNLQCEAALPINGEAGTYNMNDNPRVTCSIWGLFLNTNLPGNIHIGDAQTGYTNGLQTFYGCEYRSLACIPGTGAVCTGGLGFTLSPGCYDYFKAWYLTASVNGGLILCFTMWTGSWTGPVYCY